jgi:hypothetical protein
MELEHEKRFDLDPVDRELVEDLVEKLRDDHRTARPGKRTQVEDREAPVEERTAAPGRRTSTARLENGAATDTSPVPSWFAGTAGMPLEGAGFEAFQARGLRDVLHALGAVRGRRCLMNAVLAIAHRAARPGMPQVTVRPAPPDPAGQAMWQTAERRAATLYRRAVDAGEVRADDPSVADALARIGGGQPLPEGIRREMEADIGVSFERVRIHTDEVAAAAARALRAAAFTVGEDIFFAEQAFAPDSQAGRRLLAHELTHVVQSWQGRTPTGSSERVSQPDEPLEREADSVAERLDGGRTRAAAPPSSRRDAHEPGASERAATDAAANERRARGASPGSTKIHRYVGGRAPTGTTDPRALIPVADLIRYIETVERSYPTDQPSDTITRIRAEYYNGLPFEQLILDAHAQQTVQPPFGLGAPVFVPKNLAGMQSGSAAERDAHGHLTARADENARGDNPSPYIVMPDGSRIDLGHMLLGLDALIHPRAGAPYTNYGIPNIDPASFVADLALASVWTTQHAEEGRPRSGAPRPASGPSLDEYWTMSAPIEDLLGDVDSFGMHAEYAASGGRTPLSQLMRQYYLGTATSSAGVNRRWQTFCGRAGLRYTQGATITFDPGTRATLVDRVNNMSDLVNTTTVNNVGTMVFGTTARRSGGWPHTGAVVDRFLAYVGTNLQAELARRP